MMKKTQMVIEQTVKLFYINLDNQTPWLHDVGEMCTTQLSFTLFLSRQPNCLE